MVHRQTLTYRIKRVEELCGHAPTTTSGSAMLWLALTAADSAGLELE
jgi:DNA-binding PucR family transcriptional regulator